MPDIGEKAATATLAGNAFRDVPDTWRSMGTDGYAASTEQALRVVRQLAD